MSGITTAEQPGHIETNRWYDIRIEVRGSSIKCFLDNRLIHDAKTPALKALKALHASATRDQASGDIIVKVVNVSTAAQPADLKLNGLSQVTGPAKATLLTSASASDENTLLEPTKIVPVELALPVTGTTISYSFPANSLTVIRVPAK